ncbi:MAG: radical SAM protein [Deltaproteobacteria bacterium]|nr:radical SAM protein [Deltaproteobacteria bacterium]
MCSRGDMKRDVKTMTHENFVRIIDEFYALGFFPRITITGIGEPLIDPSLVEKISYAKKFNFHVSVITNATLLDEKTSQALFKSGLDRIQFSFDSIEKETYDRIRIPVGVQKKSYYEETLKNILHFIDINKSLGQGTFVSISSVQMDINKNESEAFTKFWSGKGVDNIYLPHAYTRAGKGFEKDRMSDDGELSASCLLPFKILVILSNGDIPVCGSTSGDYCAGNAFDSGVKDVWFGEKFKQVREAIIKKNKGLLVSHNIMCHKCTAWEGGLAFENYFDGCKERNQKIVECILT